ncbi:MAG: cobalamin-binding protein, partial [Bacteroidales bacterium]|nr:cobalamin-binding protein [Bacteroidales bacterium]
MKKRKNKKELGAKEVFGLLKPYIDVHTLGLSSIKNLLNECGYKVIMASEDVSEAVVFIQKINSLSKVKQWIIDNNITRLGFSYRLDPYEAKDYFCSLYYQLKNAEMFSNAGGCIKSVFFAGLPDACDLIKKEFNEEVVVFKGGETPLESLEMLGVPPEKFIKTLSKNDAYDKMLLEFGNQLITSGKYKYIKPQDHYMYKTCGTDNDSYLDRLMYCKKRKTLPLIRAHVGPYSSDRLEAVKEFMSWVKQLAGFGLLDILSIGTSQLTQSNFGEIWDGLPNGGGVPINYEHEYVAIKEAAKPMLVRTYAGTKNIPAMAELHERSLNISWHALSFWWFCEIDNRGKNTVLENLKEHIETIKYIAQTGKPLEINVPHHFAFRGSDDITYILSSYLTAKTAKKYGIKHLIVQNM